MSNRVEIASVSLVFGVAIVLGVDACRKLPGFDSRQKALHDVIAIQSGLIEYAVANGCRFPDHLDQLVSQDLEGRVYVDGPRIPKDSWGREYRYEAPSGTRRTPRVICYGRDGRPGGTGDDEDIDTLRFSERAAR
jgi:hypothetical protein